MVKKIKQLTEDELRNMIYEATCRISGKMDSNKNLQMNCVGDPVKVPDCFFDDYYGTTFKFFGLGPVGLPTHVLFVLEKVTMIKPNKTTLYENVTIHTTQLNGEKIIIDYMKNKVKYCNRQDNCIYDLKIDNRFKPLWDKFIFELKGLLQNS